MSLAVAAESLNAPIPHCALAEPYDAFSAVAQLAYLHVFVLAPRHPIK